jgi:hypothetical protein
MFLSDAQIAPILTTLFSLSLKTGKIPDDWRYASVCPAFKKDDKNNPINYRPISLTCIICKLLEHVVTSSIMKHLEYNNILYDLQHGFRSSRSCETQLVVSPSRITVCVLSVRKSFIQ